MHQKPSPKIIKASPKTPATIPIADPVSRCEVPLEPALSNRSDCGSMEHDPLTHICPPVQSMSREQVVSKPMGMVVGAGVGAGFREEEATAILAIPLGVGVELDEERVDVELVDVELGVGVLRVDPTRRVAVVLRIKVVGLRVAVSCLEECPRTGVVDIMIRSEQKKKNYPQVSRPEETGRGANIQECGVCVVE
jgi:hypothetical protein